MCVYLIHRPDGTIAQYSDQTVLDGLYECLLMANTPMKMQRWVRESNLERHQRPNETVEGFSAMVDWAIERTDAEDKRFVRLGVDFINRQDHFGPNSDEMQIIQQALMQAELTCDPTTKAALSKAIRITLKYTES